MKRLLWHVPIILLFFCLVGKMPLFAKEVTPKEDFAGETIEYTIKTWVGVKAGEAELRYHGNFQWNGKDVVLITFISRSLNFLDEEKIYADRQTLYPLFVERNLNIWGKKEKIQEFYDQTTGEVEIIKISGHRKHRQVLKRTAPVDNIYCFIYRYRRNGDFIIGDPIVMHLPTKDVHISLLKKTKLRVLGKMVPAFYMETTPAQYRIWFAQNAIRTPLRIDGKKGITNVMMIMRGYKRIAEETKGEDDVSR